MRPARIAHAWVFLYDPDIMLWITILLTLARIAGTLLAILFFVLFIAQHPPFWRMGLDFNIHLAGLMMMVLGGLLGWWKAGLAGLLMLLGYLIIYANEGALPRRFELVEWILVVGLVYLLCWAVRALYARPTLPSNHVAEAP